MRIRADDGPIVQFTLGGVALVASVVAACCFWSVWLYWYYELDADCAASDDCKCLLFGESFTGSGGSGGGGGFAGGPSLSCQYAFYSAWASAGLAACATVYFGFGRLCACGGREIGRRDVRPHPVASDVVDRPTAETRPQITGVKIFFIVIFSLMTLNMFIASTVLSSGYISTCLQYVHRVKSFVMASGNMMVELISNRMSCRTIYDFMDYLQPPSQQVTYELIHRHKRNPRESVINTWLLLTISIYMSWLTTAVWMIFTFCIYYFK